MVGCMGKKKLKNLDQMFSLGFFFIYKGQNKNHKDLTEFTTVLEVVMEEYDQISYRSVFSHVDSIISEREPQITTMWRMTK